MSYTQINAIVKKLNLTCQKSLQMAAASCLGSGHDAIELNHLLIQFLLLPLSDIYLLLHHAQINIPELMADLSYDQISSNKKESKAPILSIFLEELLRETFYIATLEYQTEEIRSGFLLFALLDSEYLSPKLNSLSRQFLQLSKEQLRAEFSFATVDSCENKSCKSMSAIRLEKKTFALAEFTHNLSQLALAQKLDPIMGREHEIRQLIDILMRRRQNNPLLVGDPGVGKTAMVEGLAQRILMGIVPTTLRNVVIHSLDINLLQAGANNKYDIAYRIKCLLQELTAADPPIILFIDEAHALLSSGPSELIDQIKPLLARGELRTIAATTWAEYKQYWERDRALNRRFQLIRVDEPSEEATIAILRGLQLSLEKYHRVQISEEAMLAAVQLSTRYLTDRQLPDKAINLLDTACARLSRAQEERCTVHDESLGSDNVNVHNIAAVIADWTGIPLSHVHGSELHSIADLEQQLQQRIFGQPYALRELVRNTQIARAQLLDSQQPAGVFLFVGPSGVGKTATAQALAELLYGGAQHMTMINLSEYQEAHRASLLLGSPPGYIGFGEAAILTEAVRRRPYSLILLDEWEKAHAKIQTIFYQIFDKGWLYDSQGQLISFKNTLFILTSTIGADLISRLCSNHENPDAGILSHAIQSDLLAVFDSSFLGRVNIIPYYPLTTEAIQQIVKLQLQDIQKRVAHQYQTTLSYDHQVIDFIVHACQNIHIGARSVMQLLNRKLLPVLAEEFLTASMKQQKIASLDIGVDEEKGIFFVTAHPIFCRPAACPRDPGKSE